MIFIIKDFRTIFFIFIVISHNVSADMFSGLLQVFVCRRVTIQEYLTLVPGYG